MRVFDLTDLLNDGNSFNKYVFNNSIVHISDNIYYMVYRKISYNLNEKIHPWRFWLNSGKIISNSLNENRYIDCLENNTVLDTNKVNIIEFVEFDSTSFVILEYVNCVFKIVKKVDNLFGKRFCQDTRIYNHNGKISISYNIFQKDNSVISVKMINRDLVINDNFIYLGDEKEMVINPKKIEKNCILHNDTVLYSIHKNFIVQIGEERVNFKSEILDRIYKENPNIYLSLSTPVIKFNNNYLSVGHVKMNINDSKIKNFIKENGMENLKYLYNRYIYFAFFFIFDDNNNIINISDFFILSNKKAVTFPTGLSYTNNGKILISYGENDDTTKIVELSKKEITSFIKESNHNFVILNPKPKNVLHLGYWNQWNAGDDAFVEVFKYLDFSDDSYKAHFKRENINYDIVALGGGDVINDYFMKSIKDTDYNVAFGVGIPYVDRLYHLKNFKNVILRNKVDYESSLEYCDNVKVTPDLVFLMSYFYKPRNLFKENKRFKVGLALPRTYYNPDYKNEYNNLIKELANVINLLSVDVDVYLIPFGINENKIKENDLIMNRELKILAPNAIVLEQQMIKSYVYDIMDMVNSMDFMICGRFHSHIFSVICEVPFVSLSCSRKCENLMKEWNYDKIYKFDVNEIDIPINFNHNSFYEWVADEINDHKDLKIAVQKINANVNSKLPEMIENWRLIIDSV